MQYVAGFISSSRLVRLIVSPRSSNLLFPSSLSHPHLLDRDRGTLGRCRVHSIFAHSEFTSSVARGKARLSPIPLFIPP